MKVIFLDIDGVLNVIGQGHDEFGQIFHKHFEDNLKYIIEETGAKLVISSSWRMSGIERMREMWDKRGIAGEIVGITPNAEEVMAVQGFEFYNEVDRGHEIQQYINEHKIKQYCIIDDDNDILLAQRKNFVRTSNNINHPDCVDAGYGLTRICAQDAIRILNSTTLI